MLQTFVAVSAVAPSLLIMWYFHHRDVFREPPRDLWMVFAGGCLIVLPVLGVARPLAAPLEMLDTPLRYGLASAFLQAAIPEEFFKFVVLMLAARLAAFDEPMDGVVYGVAASLGFATLENMVYVVSGGLAVALTRALTAVPSHAFLGAIMGFYVGRAKFGPGRRFSALALALALAVPILLHGLYDWPLLAAMRVGGTAAEAEPLILALLSLAPMVVVGEWICAVRLTRHLRRRQLEGLPEAARPPESPDAARLTSIALTTGGAILASVGSVLTLGGSWMVLASRFAGRPVAEPLAVVTVVGVTPTIIGVALFLWGVGRLNESRTRPPALAV